jgi:hypothetical protein
MKIGTLGQPAPDGELWTVAKARAVADARREKPKPPPDPVPVVVDDDDRITPSDPIPEHEIGGYSRLARAVLGVAVRDCIAEPTTPLAKYEAGLNLIDAQAARDWLLDPDEDDRAWQLVLAQLADINLAPLRRVVESDDRELIESLSRRLMGIGRGRGSAREQLDEQDADPPPLTGWRALVSVASG